MLASFLIVLLLPCRVQSSEFSVVFAASPLGLQLDSSLRVAGFSRAADGSRMPAETSGWLRRGDVLEAVNRTRVAGLSLATVTALIASTDPPRELTFSAPGTPRAEEMAKFLGGPRGIHGHAGTLELSARDGGASLGGAPFLQAAFGGQLSCAASPLVLASPPQGCGVYRSSVLAAGAIVVVERGGCAFTDKAAIAQAAGAFGLVVLNDVGNSFLRMPADEDEAAKLDLSIPVVMIDAGPGADALRRIVGGGARDNERAPIARAPLRAEQQLSGATALLVARSKENAIGGGVLGRLIPEGLACKPWRRAAALPTAAPPRAALIGDAGAAAGRLFLFAPNARIADADLKRTPETGGEDGAPTAGEAQELSGRAVPVVRAAVDALGGTAFHRGVRVGFENADRAARAFTAGARSASAIDAARAERDKAARLANEDDARSQGGDADADGDARPSPAFVAAHVSALQASASAVTEFVRSPFGAETLPESRLHLVAADPADACSPLSPVPRDTAVFVTRGGCEFSQKVRAVASAGGVLMVLSSGGKTVFAAQCGASCDDGLAPALMVSATGADSITALLSAPAQPASEWPRASIVVFGDAARAAAWAELALLLDPRAWPDTAALRKKTYLRLSRAHHPDKSTGAQERFEVLAFLFRRANHHWDAASEPDFVEVGDVPLR